MGQVEQQVLDFNRMFRRYDDLFRTAAHRFDIPELSLWVLYVARQIPDCTQKDIVEILCHPKQSVHSAIKQLVAGGYLKSECTRGDRRCKTLYLTAEGIALAEKTADSVIDAERRAFEALSDEERKTLLDIFGRLTRHVEAEMDTVTKQACAPGTGGGIAAAAADHDQAD